ncbi:MAG: rhomboid family intramembrane serine protease [Planctomycetales bacterium]|nr:rhomboid family intramembrane serine protease [Planctomycetales bacterium]
MFFPISDDDRALVKPAYVTWTLFALNLAAFAYQLNHPEFTYGYSVIPYEITRATDLVGEVQIIISPSEVMSVPQTPGPQPIFLTLLFSMFMHGGWAHLGGNMLFLWIFGDNVEHRFGHLPFLLFYLLSGLAASAAQIALDLDSYVPMLGASGAISGVLGAYLVLFPHNRVHAIVFLYVVSVPAWTVIGMWAITQVLHGYGSLRIEAQGGVAYAAHVGGFAAGLLMAIYCRRCWQAEQPSVFSSVYEQDPRTRRLW